MSLCVFSARRTLFLNKNIIADPEGELRLMLIRKGGLPRYAFWRIAEMWNTDGPLPDIAA